MKKLMILAGAVLALVAGARAEMISYYAWNEDLSLLVLQEHDCIQLTKDTKELSNDKWYYADNDLVFDSLTVKGTAHLILCDYLAKVTVNQGLHVNSGNSLNIYGQLLGNGSLTANSGFSKGAGIGGERGFNCGNITIHGGTVTAAGRNNAAGIGGGRNGQFAPGRISIHGGTVTASARNGATGIGSGANGGTFGDIRITGGRVTATAKAGGLGGDGTNGTVTITGGTVVTSAVRVNRDKGFFVIDGGSVNMLQWWSSPKNSDNKPLRRVMVHCPAFGDEDGDLDLDGLWEYGDGDIFAVGGWVYLWLPDGRYAFSLSNREKTKTCRYFAVVKGKSVTVEEVFPSGFFVNGVDIGTHTSGEGWSYGNHVLTLSAAGTYVLSGLATNDEVQVAMAEDDVTAVLSNAVVFTSGRPALTVADDKDVQLQMKGGASYLATAEGVAASQSVTVGAKANLGIGLAPGGNRTEAAIAVFNSGAAPAIGGSGAVKAQGGTLLVWSELRASEAPFSHDAGTMMMAAGDDPETARYVGSYTDEKLLAVAPALTVTVKDGIPNAEDIAVSNRTEKLTGTPVKDGTAYRVMQGDDIFVGYTVPEGHVALSPNPLVYREIKESQVVDGTKIRVNEILFYLAWDPVTRSFVERVCTDYITVTPGIRTFTDDACYVVRGECQCTSDILVEGSAHLILCDGAKMSVRGIVVPGYTEFSVYGQQLGTGQLISTGRNKHAGIGAAINDEEYENVGKIDIHGGIISATGGEYAAGIGGLGQSEICKGPSGVVTIYGGRVTARGGAFSAGIGGGDAYGMHGDYGWGSVVTVYGGTVTAIGDKREYDGKIVARDIGHGMNAKDNGSLTIYGGSIKAETDRGLAKDAAGRELFCVTARCKGLKVQRLKVEGLEGYGTDDVYPVEDGTVGLIEDEKVGESVFLRLPTRRDAYCFTISDGTTTYHYRAHVAERDVVVEPIRPLGFTVDGKDVLEGSGAGWTYNEQDRILRLDQERPYVLSGLATNDEVQVILEASGATAVLSNAVVCVRSRPALVVTNAASAATQNVAGLQMAGGASYLATTNNAAAVFVAQDWALTVSLAPGADRKASTIGVFNSDMAAAITGEGSTSVTGGTFFVWADAHAVGTPTNFTCGADELMMTGKTPEAMTYATVCTDNPCVLVGPGVTVTVKDGIPHVTDVVVSNRIETIAHAVTVGGTVYRVMLGDDIFVGYTLENGYFSRVENPLVYPEIDGDVTIDASTIPVLQDLPYRAWNEKTRKMEDCVCTNYTVVTADTATFENGRWYAVTGTVNRGMIAANGAAHLILCDGARLTARGGKNQAGIAVLSGNSLAIYGQALGTGELVAQGAWGGAGIGSGNGEKIPCGAVTIDGGRVRTAGGWHAAGIGGGHKGTGCTVTINGGQVWAQGGKNAAGIGGGYRGGGGVVTINGGTVTAAGGSTGIGFGRRHWGDFKLTIDGGSVKANIAQGLAKNSTPTNVYCVTVKCPFASASTADRPLSIEGLGNYGTNDIYAVENDKDENRVNCVYLHLPNGTHRFTLSNGTSTLHYCAVVNGRGITVEPIAFAGFFVNGKDIIGDGPGSGDGWTYNGGVLTLGSAMTYVLTGAATNNEVQVSVAQAGSTVILSNAVVFTSGRPALVVADPKEAETQSVVALQMAGGSSFLGTTNNAAAVTVAQDRTLTVALAPGADRNDAMIGVFNYGNASAIDGAGTTSVTGGTFFVWADAHAVGAQASFTCGADELMMTGKTPEAMTYATVCTDDPCVLVGPGVTVTVKDGIPHVSDIVVSNRIEAIAHATTEGGTVYRVMLGDDIFVGYTVETGYFPQVENPLVYPEIDGDITIDANAIPVLQDLPYRAWNEKTRKMEDCVCTNYTVVTADTATFEDGGWYAVTGTVSRGMIDVNGAAHLILCDGARLSVQGDGDEAGLAVEMTNSLAIHGQALGTGELVAKAKDGKSGNRGAGIGGASGKPCGAVTIDGGRVTAVGGWDGAGIGGGYNAAGGTITVNGGQVTAKGNGAGSGLGNGWKGDPGTTRINGGTVLAESGENWKDQPFGKSSTVIVGGSIRAANYNNTPAVKDGKGENAYCVTVKCPFVSASAADRPLSLDGLGNYGTNDIYAVEGKVYLWLPNGTHLFKLSDGATTFRYCAVVKGRAITVEPLGPIGFFVNGVDVGNASSGTGWTYQNKILTLGSAMTYVLSGAATNNEVQVSVAQTGATVVLSNAVVFTEKRPALVVANSAVAETRDEVELLMAGCASFLGTTNNAAAVSVAQGRTLKVALASGADRNDAMIGVFNSDAAATIGGDGRTFVEGGTFFVWADGQAVETPVNFTYGMGELMKTGKTPEAMTYAETCTADPCVLVGPAVTVMVRDIPHVTDVVVSNRIEAIAHTMTVGGTVYRVMLGDDIFVGYTVEKGYFSRVANPLVYPEIEGDVTIDASTIPVSADIPYRAWNEKERKMEDCVCTNYTVVTAETTAFENGRWYVVTNDVARGSIRVNGSAYLILCDGAKLSAQGDGDEAGLAVEAGHSLAIYGQALGTGELEAKSKSVRDGNRGAGIGGASGKPCGAVTIDGGRVTAVGGWDGAGIGGGYNAAGGTITVNGGQVTAKGNGAGSGLGNGWKGAPGTTRINGGTVLAESGENWKDQPFGKSSTVIVGGSIRAANYNNTPAVRDGKGENAYCVTVKCPFVSASAADRPLALDGLGNYGTNDIYAVEGKVYLWLPNGTYHFTLSDGTTTYRYCAVVKGRAITVEPLGPIGFFVNGKDIGGGFTPEDGWTYLDRVLTLGSEMTYVLSGSATNNKVQVSVVKAGATVVLSNAVVFTEGCPALDIAQNAALQMAGASSFLGATNNAAAVSVANGAALTVALASGANRNDAMIGVFNYGNASAIAGAGSVAMNGGTLAVWADKRASEVPLTRAADVFCMVAGNDPETAKVVDRYNDEAYVFVTAAIALVTPGTPIGPFETAVTATNAAQVAVINPRDDVAAALGSDEALGAYCDMFGFAVTGGGTAWQVAAVLKPEPWTNVVLSAQAATRQIPVKDIAAMKEETKTVTVTNCVPGFFYSLYDGSAVTNITIDAETVNRNVICGKEKAVAFPKVKKPSDKAGFFSIGVSERPEGK